MNDKEFKKLLEKWGAKQVESFWINSIIELTPKQRKIINEDLKKGRKRNEEQTEFARKVIFKDGNKNIKRK